MNPLPPPVQAFLPILSIIASVIAAPFVFAILLTLSYSGSANGPVRVAESIAPVGSTAAFLEDAEDVTAITDKKEVLRILKKGLVRATSFERVTVSLGKDDYLTKFAKENGEKTSGYSIGGYDGCNWMSTNVTDISDTGVITIGKYVDSTNRACFAPLEGDYFKLMKSGTKLTLRTTDVEGQYILAPEGQSQGIRFADSEESMGSSGTYELSSKTNALSASLSD